MSLKLAENLPQIIFKTDANGIIEFLNKNGQRKLKLSPSALEKGVSIFSLIRNKDRAAAKVEMLQFNRPKRLSYKVVRVDNEGFLGEFHISPNIEGGKFTGMQGILIDATVRECIKMGIEEDANKYKELFNNISSGVIVFQAIENGNNFIISSMNRAATKIERLSKRSVIGERITDVLPNIKDIELFKALQYVYRRGRSKKLKPLLYADKRISGWREYYIYKLPNNEVVMAYDDVTERRLILQNLHESEEKFRQIFESSSDAMMLGNGEDGFFECNKAAQKLFGASRSKLLSMNPNIIWPEKQPDGSDSAKVVYRNINEAFKTGRAFFEMVIKRLDGKEFYGEVLFTPFKHRGKGCIFSITRDVTERKKAELKLKKTEELYRSLVSS